MKNAWKVEIWCWGRVEKISRPDQVRNGELLLSVEEEECPTQN
jgi:hypothetical protein